jgi:CHAD domain-containing protein
MKGLGPEALAGPPAEGVRAIVRELLARSSARLERVYENDDPEALHDFRVSLRRLRATLGAYREQLPARRISRALRLLRGLTSRTNRARDLEVQLAWLEREGRLLPGAAARGAERLRGELEERTRVIPEAALAGLRRSFAALERELRPALRRSRARDGDDAGFAALLARLVRAHARSLRSCLDRVHSAAQRVEPHRARIQAKRVRYLIEPLARELPDAKSAVQRLSQLQDLLGELNDLWTLGESAADAFERASLARVRAQRAAARRGDLGGCRPGIRDEEALLALVAELTGRRAERFAELRASWLEPGLSRCCPSIAAAVRTLEGIGCGGAPGGVARRRTRVEREP